jgi:hypothetical protein
MFNTLTAKRLVLSINWCGFMKFFSLICFPAKRLYFREKKLLTISSQPIVNPGNPGNPGNPVQSWQSCAILRNPAQSCAILAILAILRNPGNHQSPYLCFAIPDPQYP